MKRLLDAACCGLASCFFLTYPLSRWRLLPTYQHTGAGLIGTAFGLLTIGWVPLDPWRGGLVVLGGILVAVVVSDVAEACMGKRDDSRIVIDEWVGYWCTAAFLPRTWPVLLSAFLLFRLFDVTKPLYIRASCRLPGGWGVVMDDVLAGLTAHVVLRLALVFTR